MANISVTMAAAFRTTAQINVFNQSIFIIITDLKSNIGAQTLTTYIVEL